MADIVCKNYIQIRTSIQKFLQDCSAHCLITYVSEKHEYNESETV